MASVFSDPRFYDEQAAYAWVETRVWPDGPLCPHCGAVDTATPLQGKSTRVGVYKCRACRKPFTVKVGTIFEASHVPMHIWLQAIALLTASKKGMSSNQLHRTLGVTLKTAWFMSHRIREAMRDGSLAPLGGNGKIVEADETYIGRKAGWKPQRRGAHKMKVLSLVERGGKVRSVGMAAITVEDVTPKVYVPVGREMDGHEAVNHSAEEWVRGEAHTNTLEGYFSVFKRGMKGVYQHCGEAHLHRYLAEFDFRYNHRVALGVNDAARADQLIKGIVGKRLTYRAAY